jgi:hypothetical protein
MAIQKLLLKATRNLQLMKIAAQSADTETAETTIRNMRSMVRLQRLQKSTMKNRSCEVVAQALWMDRS